MLVGSVLGDIAAPFMTAYVVSKWAIRSLGRQLALENRDLSGVHVSVVSPGGVDTPIYESAANYLGLPGRPPPPVTTPERVAKAVLRVLDHPRDRRQVGIANNLMRAGFTLAPWAFDALVGPMFGLAALDRTRRVPATPGFGAQPGATRLARAAAQRRHRHRAQPQAPTRRGEASRRRPCQGRDGGEENRMSTDIEPAGQEGGQAPGQAAGAHHPARDDREARRHGRPGPSGSRPRGGPAEEAGQAGQAGGPPAVPRGQARAPAARGRRGRPRPGREGAARARKDRREASREAGEGRSGARRGPGRAACHDHHDAGGPSSRKAATAPGAPRASGRRVLRRRPPPGAPRDAHRRRSDRPDGRRRGRRDRRIRRRRTRHRR